MTTTWHERWAEKRTGWDLNGPHTLTQQLIQLVSHLSPETLCGKWLIPGCGRAHDAGPLLQAGAAHVTGRDLVPIAIEEARSCYAGIQNLSLECGDILDVLTSDEASIDAVFDRAMLCALGGNDRIRYVHSVTKLCRVGGIFASIAFAQTNSPDVGPPFQISESELRELFEPRWNIAHLEKRTDGVCDDKILAEWLFIARKR